MRARLLLLCGGLLAAVLLAEGGVRLFDRYRCLMAFSGNFWEPNVFYGWGHTPGAFGWAKRCLGTRVEWESFTRINHQGLRDREIPYARSDAFRVLVLGDSYTEGMQVDVAQTFPKLLERHLSRPGRRVEVLNAGCSGFGTDNALLFYRTEGRRYRPDLVILAFDTGNDVFENYAPLMREGAFPYGRKPYFLLEEERLVLHDFPLPVPRRWPRMREALKRALWRHSMLYRSLVLLGLPRIGAVAAAAAPATPARRAHPIDTLRRGMPPMWREAWQVTRALVRRLRHDVEHDGARFAVVVLSSPWEVSRDRLSGMLSLPRLAGEIADYDFDQANRRMLALLERSRIPHVGLVEVFRAHREATGVSGYFDFDEHWNAAGHALAAAAIAEGLGAQGLLPPEAGRVANVPGAG